MTLQVNDLQVYIYSEPYIKDLLLSEIHPPCAAWQDEN